MADLSFRPEALPGTCSNGDPDAVCALFVNTTLYEPLILELGPAWEQYTSRGTQWFTFILSVFMSFWFVYNMFTGHCGWEVIFVTVIECECSLTKPADELATPRTLFFSPHHPASCVLVILAAEEGATASRSKPFVSLPTRLYECSAYRLNLCSMMPVSSFATSPTIDEYSCLTP